MDAWNASTLHILDSVGGGTVATVNLWSVLLGSMPALIAGLTAVYINNRNSRDRQELILLKLQGLTEDVKTLNVKTDNIATSQHEHISDHARGAYRNV